MNNNKRMWELSNKSGAFLTKIYCSMDDLETSKVSYLQTHNRYYGTNVQPDDVRVMEEFSPKDAGVPASFEEGKKECELVIKAKN
jgi:hypothetical protein